MASFTLNICGAPYSTSAPLSAWRFAQACVAAGHQVEQVFLYQDGVYLANSLNCPPQDEINLTQVWQQLAAQQGFSLNVCVAAALRRGILDVKEAKRYGLAQHNLAAGFELVGLGELVTGLATSTRTVTFK